MEEEDDSSEVSSPPLLPIRPTPTSFFQPFLPRPPNSSQENNNVIKPLPFSIDNILRPTFGGRGISGTDGHALHSIFSSPFLHSSAFMAAAAFAAAASAVSASTATPIQSTNSVSATPNLPMGTPLSPTLSTTSSTSSSTNVAASTPVKKEAKVHNI